jgi:hypothetical protein
MDQYDRQTIYVCNLEIWAAGEGLIRSRVVRLRNKMVPETIFTSSRWHGDIIHSDGTGVRYRVSATRLLRENCARALFA